jgi:uridylate kinase
MKYKRVLLKLSGETLAGAGGSGIDPESLAETAAEIKTAVDGKLQMAIVIGAGNLWRGAGKALDRVTADYMGMLATIMNALALKEALLNIGVPAVVRSAFEVSKVAGLYVRDEAVEQLNAGKIVFLAGGTGNPFFTTDTTAALRAAEIGADVLLKATQVDGVYDADPRQNPSARRYDTVSFDEAITKQLKVMDTAAFSLCRDNNIPIMVFDFHKKDNLRKAVAGEKTGTLVFQK